jgi:hypothetical protein
MWLNFFRGVLLSVVGALLIYRERPWYFAVAIFCVALWFFYEVWREDRQARGG